MCMKPQAGMWSSGMKCEAHNRTETHLNPQSSLISATNHKWTCRWYFRRACGQKSYVNHRTPQSSVTKTVLLHQSKFDRSVRLEKHQYLLYLTSGHVEDTSVGHSDANHICESSSKQFSSISPSWVGQSDWSVGHVDTSVGHLRWQNCGHLVWSWITCEV